MGFLKRLSRSSGKDQIDETSEISIAEVSVKSNGTRSSRRSSKSSGSLRSPRLSNRKVPKAVVAEEPLIDGMKPNEKIVSDFYAMMSKGCTVKDMLECFASPEVPIIQEDIPTTTAAVFSHMMVEGRRSFPDAKLTADIREEKRGVVVADDSIVTGTFTGAPFQPLPHLKPLEANGRSIVLDPERVYYSFENGKITKIEVIAMGNHTGPIGFYILAGGKM